MTFDYADDYERLFDHTYLRWFDLEGQPALVEIVHCKQQELTLRGGVKKKAPVCTIKQIQGQIKNVRPLVLNKTNAETIAGFLGRKPNAWAGQQIVLLPAETKLGGETVPCIRIRKPKENT